MVRRSSARILLKMLLLPPPAKEVTTLFAPTLQDLSFDACKLAGGPMRRVDALPTVTAIYGALRALSQ